MRPRDPQFWDGASFALRLLLAFVHVLFGMPFLMRPNIPLLFDSFGAFDDLFPASHWGWWSLIAALLLILVPTRVPLGLISTAFSAYLMFAIGATFGQGAGLIPGTTVYSIGLGGVALLLFMRALWLWVHVKPWFQALARRGGQHGR